MAQKQTADVPTPSFESAMERLEQIVEAMEGDQLPLEKLLEQYEEGSKLVKVCQEKLEAAERRVEIIARTAGGKVQTVPFEPPATPIPTTPESTPEAAAPTPAKKIADRGEVSLF